MATTGIDNVRLKNDCFSSILVTNNRHGNVTVRTGRVCQVLASSSTSRMRFFITWNRLFISARHHRNESIARSSLLVASGEPSYGYLVCVHVVDALALVAAAARAAARRRRRAAAAVLEDGLRLALAASSALDGF